MMDGGKKREPEYKKTSIIVNIIEVFIGLIKVFYFSILK